MSLTTVCIVTKWLKIRWRINMTWWAFIGHWRPWALENLPSTISWIFSFELIVCTLFFMEIKFGSCFFCNFPCRLLSLSDMFWLSKFFWFAVSKFAICIELPSKESDISSWFRLSLVFYSKILRGLPNTIEFKSFYFSSPSWLLNSISNLFRSYKAVFCWWIGTIIKDVGDSILKICSLGPATVMSSICESLLPLSALKD